MNRTVRSVATSLAVGFALYFAARAVWWIVQPTAPLLMVLAIALYLLVVNLAILGSPDTVKLPLWTAMLAVIASVIIPIAVTFSLNEAGRTAPFATWYIGGVGLLSVILIVRRRFLTGWLILLLLVATSSVFLGFLESLLNFGLVGSIMWVVVANLLVWFWDRAVRDTERLAEIQQAVSAWHATQLVRQRERRVRTQFALAVAGPVLSRAVATRGSLTEEERLDARLAEGACVMSCAEQTCSTMRSAMRSKRRVGAVRSSRCSTRAVSRGSTRRVASRSGTSSPASWRRPTRDASSSVPPRTIAPR